MSRQAFEHLHQSTALLTGADHVGEHVRENDRLTRHSVGKAFAFNDILLELGADLIRDAFTADIGHTVQRGCQGHTGFEQVRELIGIVGQLLERRFSLTGEVIPKSLGQEV